MKKKLSAFLAVLLGALSISAPAQVLAEDMSNYGTWNDPLTIVTNSFTYSNGAFRNFSEDVLPYDAFAMVESVWYQENQTEPYAYVVRTFARCYPECEIDEDGNVSWVKAYLPDGGIQGAESAVLYADELKKFFDGAFESGDLFTMGGYVITETSPSFLYLDDAYLEGVPISIDKKREYLGNASTLLGDEAMEAVRHEAANGIMNKKEYFAKGVTEFFYQNIVLRNQQHKGIRIQKKHKATAPRVHHFFRGAVAFFFM